MKKLKDEKIKKLKDEKKINLVKWKSSRNEIIGNWKKAICFSN